MTSTDTDLARAFRAARRYYGESGGFRGTYRAAPLALALARKRLESVAEARAAYYAANPATADHKAAGGLPIDSAEGHTARAAYVNARSRAGLYHTRESWSRTYPESDSAFRCTMAAHDLPGGPDHNGWYDNPHSESARDGSGLMWGVVCQLPGRNGCARYVAGYAMGSCAPTQFSFDLGTIHTAPGDDCESAQQEAARAADSMAEAAAEAERDYQEAWQAGSQWADLGAQVDRAKAEIRELLAERKAARAVAVMLPPIPRTCEHLARAVSLLWSDVQEARAERAEIAGGLYWSRHDLTPLEAFAEGAGLTMADARGLCS